MGGGLRAHLVTWDWSADTALGGEKGAAGCAGGKSTASAGRGDQGRRTQH